MTRDDVIRMARQVWGDHAILPFEQLERFAELVAAQEREACAKLCEEHAKKRRLTTILLEKVISKVDYSARALGAMECSEAIRARAKEQTP